MKLNDYKEEVYKCSGCGMCQSVCPVYKVLKTECAVSRGKFKLLNAIINQDLKFSKKTLGIMDLCLHCQACTEFCPSDIDAQKIIETAQNDMRECGISHPVKLLTIRVLSSKFLMRILKVSLNVLRKTKLLEVLSILKCKKIELLKEFLQIKVQPIIQKSETEKKYKALYFKGCINNYINPSCENAVKKVLDKTEIEIVDADFECCGLPAKSAGDFESFKKLAIKNISLIDENVDYILFDCSSCLSTFYQYEQFLDGEFKEKFDKIKSKFVSIYQLLDKINYEYEADWKEYSVTFHYPCHTRGAQEKESITKIVKNLPNTKFVELNEANSCCGAAGSFILTNSKISEKISENKAENIVGTQADIVLTTCPSCVLGLKQGLLRKKSNMKVQQLIEFIAQK